MSELVLDTVVCMDALDFLRGLPDASVNCCITSPPYFGLRSYTDANPLEVGTEETPEQYVAALVEIFREVRRVLTDDGTCWLNLGDSYSTHQAGKVENPFATSGLAGTRTAEVARNVKVEQDNYRNSVLPEKNLLGIPWRVAFALQADGWYLRSDIIWAKPNCMPESVTDRPTKSHEYVFLLTKNASYYYDAAAIAEPAAYDGRHDTLMKGSTKYKVSVVPGQVEHTMAANGHERWQMNDDGERIRNKRTVWTIPTQPSTAAHFAVMPEALVAPCILAGCPEGGTVLDSFFGAGTVGLVAQRLGRHWLGSELNPTYVELATARIQGDFEQYQAREAGLPFTPRLFE